MVHTRRAFVAGVSAAAVVGGGCLEESTDGRPGNSGGNGDDEEGNGDDRNGNGEETDEAENDDAEGKRPPTGSVYVVQVERVDRETVADRFDVGRLGEQPSAVREAVRTATDETYRTEDVGDALGTFVADHEYVRVDGAYYALEPTFPLEVLRAEPVDREDVDASEIADARDFREDAVAADAVGEAVADGRAERVTYPAFLHDLVAEYDYVTPGEVTDDDTDVYAWSLETDDRGGPPYRLEVESVGEADVFGDDVLDLESLPSDAREEIRTAREEDGRVSYDDSPAILDEGPPQFVRVDDAYYEVLVSVGN